MLGCRIAGLYGNTWTFQVAQLVKDSSANTRDARDAGWIPGSERSPGGENGNPLQYSCLKKSHGRRYHSTEKLTKYSLTAYMRKESKNTVNTCI